MVAIVKESVPKDPPSGLGIIVGCPDFREKSNKENVIQFRVSIFLVWPYIGEIIRFDFDAHIFQMGWTNELDPYLGGIKQGKCNVFFSELPLIVNCVGWFHIDTSDLQIGTI